MIANLPAKRATRKVIGEEPDIKTRSQATISSGSITSAHPCPRSQDTKSAKLGRGRPKLFSHKKLSDRTATEEKGRKKESFTIIKEEPIENIKEEPFDSYLEPLEAEHTIQHSDILTSLQMIPVVKKNPEAAVKQKVEVIEEPMETSKILAAMREAMMDSSDTMSSETVAKSLDSKKKKIKSEEKTKRSKATLSIKKNEVSDENVIICNGCGMQFDNSSACLRHKKKCVYWKEDKSCENSRNKCSNCGLMFPYLMALLRHDCLKVEVADEPAMPELCPEKPVEEVQCSGSGAEDIPILSPVGAPRDDTHAKRMSLAEETVKEVSVETFDITDYHRKWFTCPIKRETKEKAKKNLKKRVVDCKVLEKTQSNNRFSPAFDDTDRMVGKVKQENSTSTLNVKEASRSSLSLSKKHPRKVVSSPNQIEAINNKKVSEIFKEVKRRGRKPKLLPYNATKKHCSYKTGLKGLVARKKTACRKSRSSNFVMLMREWEKLEKDGAVAIGKRKRQITNFQVNFGLPQRSRRFATNLNNSTRSYDTESSTNESISPAESLNEPLLRRTRKTSSFGQISDTFNDSIREAKSTMSLDNIKTERNDANMDESILRKITISDKTAENIVDEEVSISLVKEDMNETSVKRRPGRPRNKNITFETEEHINETIDSIIMRSTEVKATKIQSDVSKVKSNLILKEPITVEGKISLKSEDKDLETKDKDCVVKSKDEDKPIKAKENKDLKWINVKNVINNVSIGNADVFFTDKGSSSTNITLKKKGRTMNKPKILRSMATNQSDEKTTISVGELSSNTSSNGLFHDVRNKMYKNSGIEYNEKFKNNKSKIIFTQNSEKSTSSAVEISKHSVGGVSASQTVRGKRKLSFSEEDRSSSKHKEVKTKQLSIADYLSISQFVNKSSEPLLPQLKPSSSDENKINKNQSSCEPNQVIDDEVEISSNIQPKNEDSISNLPKVAKIAGNCKKSTDSSKNKIKSLCDLVMDSKPSSPESVSSKEDVALSVIREKVLQKRKKKLKMKKILKKKQRQLLDNKICKITKSKLISEKIKKDKLKKGNTNVKVGVSRNCWEVSVVENKNNLVEELYENDTQGHSSNMATLSTEPVKKFYCATCDQMFESSFILYQHQLTAEHKRNTLLAEQQRNISDDSDPVKYCKSIGNIINDLEKRTLNVAKVMHHLKQGEPSADSLSIAESSNTKKESADWSRCPTPSWETQQQAWEVDSFSTSSSLGSIMDTVNKLLSSDQETVPPYSWADLQLAMGASDEEMAMLEQLGEHSLQEEYVYDSSRPVGDWLPPQESSPTLTDLDNQEAPNHLPITTSTPDLRKLDLASESELETKACRSAQGRPRRLLGEYETKEMVCPTCNRHFLGLLALQTHIAWSHCAPVLSSSRLVSGLKRRALDEVDRRLVCFVCKEIVPSATKLEAHILAQHTKKLEEQDTKPVVSESAEKLRSKMSLALGGLVDRALNKMLGSNKALSEPSTSQGHAQADLNTGALQLLGRLCAARKRVGSDNIKSVTVGSRLSSELLQLVGRMRRENSRPVPSSTPTVDVKPTNLLDHLAVCSSDVQQRPYACPICDLRFLIPSTRNRHIARAHGTYGRRYDQDLEGQEDVESGWKEALEAGVEPNDDGEMLPLCSDCGLSFQSIHEVIQHRIEDHPRRFSANETNESKSLTATDKRYFVESSCEDRKSLQSKETTKSNVKLLPVSDNAIDSTSTNKKKRGRPAKRKLSDSEKKCCNKKSNQKSVEKNAQSFEIINETISETATNYFTDTVTEESNSTDTLSPETDKSPDKTNDQHSRNSSEENLAELLKRDRRKIRMGNMGEEAVRVKAEAALRELNLSRKFKSSPSPAKWGVDSMKFTKQIPPIMSSSQVSGSPSKGRFASLVEKKWKSTSASDSEVKTEPQDVNSDIYDFRDEDSDKKPFQQVKESHLSGVENVESNKLVKSINSNISGSLKKVSQSNKLSLDYS